MSEMSAITFEIDDRGVATLTLDRPEVRNAMNGEMMSQVTETISNLPADARVLILKGSGKVFSAGADLSWMMSAAAGGSGGFGGVAAPLRTDPRAPEAANPPKSTGDDSSVLLELFSSIDTCRVPVVAQVHGAAMAGAAGMVACCDVAVAAEGTVFGFTEVRLGLVPAVISPYVVRKMGYSFARAAFLTAERFDARRAYEVGLVHRVVPLDDLEFAVQEAVQALLLAGPEAIREARQLVDRVWGRAPSEVADVTVAAITERRASEEGREGVTAFLEKRRPRWAQPDQ